uniref:Pentatricopeptide repeat-containing protein At1g08070, chloroplastic n=1 Tax=Elaeis guineensis var. tenera TaxID=51953 RepID=A0A6I9S1U8_ELAGV|nr:pentatricopeptide repeat-containing protein At1g08070, chloroplastic [Elaeis guineensis]
MNKFAISPDLFTFPPLLKSLAQLSLPCLGIPIHACIVKLGFGSDVYTNTALVNVYCTFTRVDGARKLFDEMPNRNSVSWNAMITGYVHNRRFREAHELFSEMLASGVELSEVTMVCALSACAHLGALNQGLWIHNYIRNHGLRLNVFVGTALIDMYMKCGVVDEALKVFRAMRVKNVFSWNSLMSGFAMNGRGEVAMEAFDMMVKENIKPDGVTFLALLGACCHQGCVGEGRKLFADMEREFGVRPRMEHYGCMVDLLSRAGFLEEAYELVKTMPIEADAVIWRALLGGCRIHGNTQLGELAIEKLLELEPGSGENYVLLSNVLARDRRWSEVGKVREVMSQRGIRKAPGCSSIEIDNVVYEFVVTTQFEKDGLNEIYTMLENMKRELRTAGYAADTEMVSYDLEEEEKESSLMHHSEKLALAFGLLKTQQGSSIRIVKNLRVCKDCHSFFKFASKIYRREIVVRDRNRFHHFSAGLCSCRDYW